MKKQYISPATAVIQVCGGEILAVSGEAGVDVNINEDEIYDGVFRMPRQPNLWEDEKK